MNERIRELERQATSHMPGRPPYDGLPFAVFDKKKFAELIVRECADLFPNVYVSIENDYGHTPVIASDYIKKHFGVEE